MRTSTTSDESSGASAGASNRQKNSRAPAISRDRDLAGPALIGERIDGIKIHGCRFRSVAQACWFYGYAALSIEYLAGYCGRPPARVIELLTEHPEAGDNYHELVALFLKCQSVNKLPI